MYKKHTCTDDCHKCLNCGQKTFMPSAPARPKKFCDNKCQLAYQYARGIGPKKLPKWLSRELMERMYVTEKKSLYKIGKELGKSQVQVGRYLKRFDIPRRAFSTKGIKTRLGHKHTAEAKEKIRQKAFGRIIPVEVRRKMGSPGSRNPGWIDGRTPKNKLIRHSLEYKVWRKAVFARDNFTCVSCTKRGGEIHADHIAPFAYFPELRFSVDNGRTLCVDCHRKTPTYGGRKKLKS